MEWLPTQSESSAEEGVGRPVGVRARNALDALDDVLGSSDFSSCRAASHAIDVIADEPMFAE